MTHRRPAGLIKRAVSRDGRLMDSRPGVTFLRLIGAAKIPRACRKPSRYITYRARLMGLGDRIDVFFHAFSDVYSRLGDRGRGERAAMKIVVIGGSGLIGKKVVMNLRQHGHEVLAASPSSGVNTVTGKGLAQALAAAQVVVDVSNAPNWEDNAVLAFFETSGRNLLAAEAAAGVGHHVALSVVGTDRLLASGYFRAKMAQEDLIKPSGIPYTIVRATQFFEFMGGIAQFSTVGQTVHLPAALWQPIAADDVASALAEVTLGAPVNDVIEIAGPKRAGLD